MKKMIHFTPFLFFLFWVLAFHLMVIPLNFDEIWSYGFTNNIYRGLLPYKDFNMVITPLYPFLFSLPFHLFGSSLFLFHLENAILTTLILIFSYELVGKRASFLLPLFVLPYSLFFPNYNLLLLFLFILLLYAEKKGWNDYWIGIVLGLLFLTKQSVGGVFLFSILYFFQDKKKMGQRLLGFLTPNLFFLLVLFFTKSISSFLDLCVLGLFDFGSQNGKGFTLYFFLSLILFCFFLFQFVKEKDLNVLYILLFFSICIPLFDLYHFLFLVYALVLFLLQKPVFKILNPHLVGGGLFVGLTLLSFCNSSFDKTYPNSIPHFEYRYLSQKAISYTNEVNDYLDKHSKEEAVFLSIDAYYFRIIRDENVDFLDLINYGNHGYHSHQKLLNLIQKKKDAFFYLEKDGASFSHQLDRKAIQYVRKHGEKVDEVSSFEVYRLVSKNS